MTWVKLDDAFGRNPKVLAIPPLSRLLYISGLCYCASFLTDGRIPKTALPVLLLESGAKKSGPDDLVRVGMWSDEGSYWAVHDFLQFNPSREQVLANRKTASRRQALHNDVELKAEIRKRDRDRCRYCSQRVNWRDRKGSHGGTYDHVDPQGENSFSNVVVACRGCNSKKGQRTPEQAGMDLLPICSQADSEQIQADGDLLYPTRPDPTPIPPYPPEQVEQDNVVPFSVPPPKDELRNRVRASASGGTP